MPFTIPGQKKNEATPQKKKSGFVIPGQKKKEEIPIEKPIEKTEQPKEYKPNLAMLNRVTDEDKLASIPEEPKKEGLLSKAWKGVNTWALNPINSLLQAPQTIGVAGRTEYDKAISEGKGEGSALLKGLGGYGKGVVDVLSSKNTADNRTYLESSLPKQTAAIKKAAPDAYNVGTEILNYVDVSDAVGVGLLGDVAKLSKLQDVNKAADVGMKANKSVDKALTKEKLSEVKHELGKERLALENTKKIYKDDLKNTASDFYDAARQQIAEHEATIKELEQTLKGKSTKAASLADDGLRSAETVNKTDDVKPVIKENATKPTPYTQVKYTVQRNPNQEVKWVKTEFGNIPIKTKTVGEPTKQVKTLLPKIKEKPLPQQETLEKIINNPSEYPADMVTRAKEKLNKIKVAPVEERGPIKRGLVETVQQNSQVADEVKAGLSGSHVQKSNQTLIDEAQTIIMDNPEKAIRMAKSETLATDLSNEVAHQLIEKANLEGRFEDAIDLIEITAKKATESGRATQALSMWARLSPEGMQKYAQRVINQANQKFAKLNPEEYNRIVNEFKKQGIDLQLFAERGKRADLSKIIKLTAEDAKYINEQMTKVAQLPDGRARDITIAQTLDHISGKIPPTLMQKISTLQTMAQLLNPKTAIRNTVGNMGFAVLRNIAQTIGTPIDLLMSAVTKQRTTTLPSIATQAKGFGKGWKLGLEDALLGVDTSGIKTQFDLPNGRTFRDGFFGALEKVMNVELKATDRAFYQAAFEDSIRSQMKLTKTTVTDEMIEKAHLEGLYATFQDSNAVSKRFVKLKAALNGGKEWGLGDVILKYPKTPANLLARGIEFSPLGVAKSLFELARPITGKAFRQKEFVSSLSRAIVGSGLAYGAYGLYNVGILTGKRVKDNEAAELQRETGLGSFSLNVSALNRWVLSGFDPNAAKIRNNDNIINYDWFQPASSTLAMGANIGEQLKNKERVNPLDVLGASIVAIEAGVKTLAEQPVVQGVAKAFGGYDVVDSMLSAVKGIPASFIPTLINQARQFVDNTSRDTKAMKAINTGIETLDNTVNESIGQVVNKIPVISRLLPERITTTGEKRALYQSGWDNPVARVFNVALNPAFPSKYKSDKGIQLVLDLYKNTGLTTQFPREAAKQYTIDKNTFTLTSAERNDVQKFIGNKTKEYLNKVANDKNFNKLNDEQKIEEIGNMLSQIAKEGKKYILSRYNKEQIVKRLK